MKRKNFTKILALLICCFMLFGILAACGGGDDNGGGQQAGGNEGQAGGNDGQAGGGGGDAQQGGGGDGGPIVSAKDSVSMVITQDVGTLNPLYLNGWTFQQAIFMIYESLWMNDEHSNMVWHLATGYDTSPDGLVWTIYLREGVKFANGNDFTAEDLIFSLYLANNREGEPPWFTYMLEDQNRAINDHTVEIHFSRYQVGYEVSFSTVAIFDSDSYDPDTVSMYTNGTGPYVVSDYMINSHLILEAKDDYWGGPLPIKTINYKIISEDAQMVNALEAGEVDISRVPFAEIEYVQNMPMINVRLVPAYSQRTILLNNTNPESPFYNNVDARRALLLAVNPEPVLRIVYNGYGELSRAPYTIFANNANPADFDKGFYDGTGYNPDLARELAISSGLAEFSQANPLRFINNGSSDMVETAELVQGMLNEIGVATDIRTYDPGSWLTYRFDHTAYDMTVDFTGATEAVTDICLWWQYCGNNAESGGNPDPAGTEMMRELTGGDRASGNIQALPEEPNAANRVAGISQMVDILNDQALFKNLVEMMNPIGQHKDLSVRFMTNNMWVDFRETYWMS